VCGWKLQKVFKTMIEMRSLSLTRKERHTKQRATLCRQSRKRELLLRDSSAIRDTYTNNLERKKRVFAVNDRRRHRQWADVSAADPAAHTENEIRSEKV